MRSLETNLNPSDKEKLYRFTNGISFDARMAEEEILVQKSWVNALNLGEYLSDREKKLALNCLDEILSLIKLKKFPWKIEDEDIHMNIERFITEKYGDLGKKIHLGRSRNDLIATTLRLFTHNGLGQVKQLTLNLMRSLFQICGKTMAIIVPGMTHQQFGRPIRLGHILFSYLCTLERDLDRINMVKASCLDYMPLGSAAFSGTHLRKMDLNVLARELGFKNPPRNSYHSVSDRDFTLESLYCFSFLGTHLSRFCEDMIYLSSTPLGIVKLPVHWSTGSSIMPNKRNPDVLELVRAKTSRINAMALEGMSIVKSVPTSYSSDFHELKKTFILCFDEIVSCLDILIPFFQEVDFSKERAKTLLNHGHILATDVANRLTENGMPFRDAYKAVASLVQEADRSNRQIHELDEFKGTFDLDFEKSTNCQSLSGGTSKDNLKAQLHYWEEKLFNRPLGPPCLKRSE